jgi:rare lipoprotein A
VQNTSINLPTIILLVPIALSLLSGCANNASSEKTSGRYAIAQDRGPTLHKKKVDIDKIPEVVPKIEPKSKYGNPKKYKVFNKEYKVMDTHIGYKERGLASWYGEKFHGHRTSSGEIYDMYQISAAHKTLPLPTYAKVTNLKNKKSLIVKINDRGPFHANRVLDLSYAAAQKLGVLDHGTAVVEVEALHPEQGYYLQIGAFNVKNNAKELAAKVKPLVLHNVNLESDHKKQTHYVRVGPLQTEENVLELMNKLILSGISSKFSIHRKN